jgi:hypothetical protein
MVAAGELEGEIEGEDEEGEEEGEEEEVKLEELLREMNKMKEPVDEGFKDMLDTVKKGVQNIFKGSEQKWLEKEITSGKYNNVLQAIEAAEDVNSKRAAAKPILDDFMAHIKSTSRSDVPDSYFREKMQELERVLGYGAGFKPSFSAAQRATTGTANEAMKGELKEALKAINILKAELNEVNLLNSKLLYVNKIFRAKNLTESQKVKVLAAFDKAATTKEAKLVFETLSEGLNEKKSSVNESMIGGASKVAGIAPTKKPILEVNDQFARWQTLAGLKK